MGGGRERRKEAKKEGRKKERKKGPKMRTYIQGDSGGICNTL
jgi:hypothetical protein